VTDFSRVKEVDWSGLSESQKKVGLKVMNENGCNCGCKMTIAVCRERDSSCRRSLIFARTILDALHEGKPENEAVRVLRPSPTRSSRPSFRTTRVSSTGSTQ